MKFTTWFIWFSLTLCVEVFGTNIHFHIMNTLLRIDCAKYSPFFTSAASSSSTSFCYSKDYASVELIWTDINQYREWDGRKTYVEKEPYAHDFLGIEAIKKKLTKNNIRKTENSIGKVFAQKAKLSSVTWLTAIRRGINAALFVILIFYTHINTWKYVLCMLTSSMLHWNEAKDCTWFCVVIFSSFENKYIKINLPHFSRTEAQTLFAHFVFC